MLDDPLFRWSIVESIPVHESIKTGKPRHVRDMAMQNYKDTVRNLGKAGMSFVQVHQSYHFLRRSTAAKNLAIQIQICIFLKHKGNCLSIIVCRSKTFSLNINLIEEDVEAIWHP